MPQQKLAPSQVSTCNSHGVKLTLNALPTTATEKINKI